MIEVHFCRTHEMHVCSCVERLRRQVRELEESDLEWAQMYRRCRERGDALKAEVAALKEELARRG